jgi:hypothetical protein
MKTLATALILGALALTAGSAQAAVSVVDKLDLNKTQLYCGSYDTLVRIVASGRMGIVKNRCGQTKFVRCFWYKVQSVGIDSGNRNSCLVRYKSEGGPVVR